MSTQRILSAADDYQELDTYWKELGTKKIFLVCGSSISFLDINHYFQKLEERMGIEVLRFSDFQPNPLYSSVVRGVELFRSSGCDLIAAVGGGSAMDVAKCIKLYAAMNPGESYLTQKPVSNAIPFLAVPTTAGTGSEATRFAVIYDQGEKLSISDTEGIPSAVLMDPSTLKSLPEYHRKATMLDALSHGIESFWSIHSTEESRQYAAEAILQVLQHKEDYLNNQKEGNVGMLRAANLAGKAINLTQTTAGHAMSYKLTGLYGIAHGHAVGLCLTGLWPYMLSNMEKCTDMRGQEYLKDMLGQLGRLMGGQDARDGMEHYLEFFHSLHMGDIGWSCQDIVILQKSVNMQRLRNHPIMLEDSIISEIYQEVLGKH